jgi:hypothetical protein
VEPRKIEQYPIYCLLKTNVKGNRSHPYLTYPGDGVDVPLLALNEASEVCADCRSGEFVHTWFCFPRFNSASFNGSNWYLGRTPPPVSWNWATDRDGARASGARRPAFP